MRISSVASLLAASALACACSRSDSKSHVGSAGGGHFDAGTPVAAASGSGTAAAGAAGAPTVTVSLSPNPAKATDAITATANAQPASAIVRYDWSIDGQDAGWSAETFPAGRAKKKQRVRVSATAVDLAGHVSAPASAEVMIVNSPPTASPGTGNLTAAAGTISMQVQASDPDGDPLTFKLPSPIAGATLSPTGALTVTTASIPAGGLTVPIEVSDPDGDKATTAVTVSRP